MNRSRTHELAERREVAREITYSHSAATRSGRALIRMLENATGRLRLIRQAQGYEVEVATGRNFWEVISERYGLSLKIIGGSLSNIPQDGPLVLIANHPFGILDGLMMGRMLSTVRPEFRILAHQIFRKAEDLNRIILPIHFEETREAQQENIRTRKAALAFLASGGAIGVFPGGTVSTAARPFSQPMDPSWRSFTARMIARSDAAVVPMFFVGHNSRFFQLASHMHQTLRTGLLIKEFKNKVNRPVEVVIGEPIDRAVLQPFEHDPRAMMDFLRQATYRLSPVPVKDLGYGFEFDERRRH